MATCWKQRHRDLLRGTASKSRAASIAAAAAVGRAVSSRARSSRSAVLRTTGDFQAVRCTCCAAQGGDGVGAEIRDRRASTASVCWPSVGGGVSHARLACPTASDRHAERPAAAPIVAMLDRRDHLTRGELRIGEQLLRDRAPIRTARRPASSRRSSAAACCCRSRSATIGRSSSYPGHALAVGREPLILGELRDRAEAAPLVVVADGEHEIAVRRGERFVWHDASDGGCPVAPGTRRVAK